jgi:hypothetical protein
MRKLLMFVLFVFWSLPAFAQDALWSRTYGGSADESGLSVQQTTDGGYIVAGYTWSFGAGDVDVYLNKTDSTGDTLWSRTYGGSGLDIAWSVQQTSDGGYIVAGWTGSFGAGDEDVYLIKTNSSGDTLWTRTYGGDATDCCYSVQQMTDGGYILAGLTYSPSGWWDDDMYLIKTNSTGDPLWTRTYGWFGTHESGTSVQQTKDGGYIVAGWTDAFFDQSDWDVYLIKADSGGDIQWSRTYGGSGFDIAWSVQQTIDEGYIVSGVTESFGAGGGDVYLIKTDSTGDTLWTRTYGGNGNDCGFFVEQTTDGGYIVSAHAGSSCLIKTDSTGDTLWSRTCGGSEGHSVQQTKDGGYIIVAGGGDALLTKLDSFGNTCTGEFVSSTVMRVPSTVRSLATEVTSYSFLVTSPPTEVTSPATEVTTVCITFRGDANKDGVINIGDVVYLVTYLFLYGPAPDPLWLGDANCDGKVDIADVVYLLNYLFLGGPPPGC